MNVKQKQIIAELIEAELLTAKIYLMFQKLFPRDSELWEKLAKEEMRHAHMLLKFKQFFKLDEKVMNEFMDIDLNTLIENNKQNRAILDEFKENGTREDCFKLALELEKNSGETHYRKHANEATESEILKVFKNLNAEDIRHHQMILDYIKENEIKF